MGSPIGVVEIKHPMIAGVLRTTVKLNHVSEDSPTEEQVLLIHNGSLVNGALPHALFRNADSSVLGFNFRPATKVNKICLAVVNASGDLVLMTDLNTRIVSAIKTEPVDESILFLEAIEGRVLNLITRPYGAAAQPKQYRVRLRVNGVFQESARARQNP